MLPGARPLGAQRANQPQFVSSFDFSASIQQQLDRLDRLAQQKLWEQWLTGYQRLVDDHPDGVVPRDDEFLVGLRYLLAGRLAALPAAIGQQYRAKYDPAAREIYDQALRAGDAAPMREIVTRYRMTSYWRRALTWLANDALDSGNLTIAHAAYAQVATERTVTPNTLVRYAMASQQLRRIPEARATLQRLSAEFGGERLRLQGKTVTGAEAAAQLLAQLAQPTSPPTADWERFTGPDWTRRMSGAPAAPFNEAWKYVYPVVTEPDTRAIYRRVVIGAPYGSGASRFGYLSFPVVSGERVLAQGPKNVVSLDLADGKALWSQSAFKLPPEALPPVPRGRAAMGLPYYAAGQSFQSAPTRSGRWVVARIPIINGQPAYSSRRSRGQRTPLNYALMVTDAASGEILWKSLAPGDPPGSIFNTPAIHENTIFTGAGSALAGITEFRAVAMQAGTGELLWSTYLGGGSDPLLSTDGSPPVVRNGLVWLETTLYTLSALDVVTGEIRHIYRYTPEERLATQRSSRYRTVVNEPISLLAGGDGPLVLVPRWGRDVVAIDPKTGQLLWAAPRGYGVAVFGVDDRRAYVCGSTLQAYDLKTGARQWVWDPQAASSNVGYAALVGDKIYVVVEGRLEIRAADDGRSLGQIDLTEFLGDSPGYTSLIARPDLLLIGTRGSLVALRSAGN